MNYIACLLARFIPIPPTHVSCLLFLPRILSKRLDTHHIYIQLTYKTSHWKLVQHVIIHTYSLTDILYIQYACLTESITYIAHRPHRTAPTAALHTARTYATGTHLVCICKYLVLRAYTKRRKSSIHGIRTEKGGVLTEIPMSCPILPYIT